MTRAGATVLACLLALGGAGFQPANATAEVIDRVVAVAGTDVITQSELLRQMRISALLSGQPLDLSPAAKRATLDRMIRQALIRREMDVGHYPLPPMTDIDKVLADFRKEHFTGDAEFRKALQENRISEDDLRDEIRRQVMTLRFIDFRFAPAVQVSNAEIRDYYRKNAAKLDGHPLEDVRDSIERVLREEKVNQALDKWLAETRDQTRVEIREEALE